MGAYPAGCTQAMHDRAFGNEDREPCQTCDGDGKLFADENAEYRAVKCADCNGTGYEQPADTREDDAYEQFREDEGTDDAF